MLKKRQQLFASVLFLFFLAFIAGNIAVGKNKKSSVDAKALERERALRMMDDSLLSQVKIEDLLDDEVYQKLAYEGWTPQEIVRIMKTSIADKSVARNKVGYGNYAKRWLPDYGVLPGNDSLYTVVDSVAVEEACQSVRRTVPLDELHRYWPPLPYQPPRDRSDLDRRNPGYFRQPKFKPSVGRMSSVTLDPENPDRLYVAPAGAGIFRTNNLGKHWDCITDRIPDRYDRLIGCYGIPVDPDNFDHVFCLTSSGKVYESTDGGQSWELIPGATTKSFKRVFCVKDKKGNLKFIGCTRGNPIWTTSTVWISEDKGVTWTAVTLPDNLKDTHAYSGQRGTWFQEVLQDPSNRDMILLPTPRSIFYFDDGAESHIVNGQKVYNIKKLEFEVYDDKGNRRYAEHELDQGRDPAHTNNTIFPCPSTQPGNLLINPNNPDEWWFATGCQAEFGLSKASVLFYSNDHGKTWETRHDRLAGIGSGCLFGHTLCDSWLGGFAVNFADTRFVYGCNTTCASSSDGGRNFYDFGWHYACKAQHDDGKWYNNSYSRHNSDNHYMASHKSGRIFRCSDGGMLCVDQNLNDGIWFEIGGDMGQMLFYNVAVNEFGDQVIFGNTQDTDGQTYRYGRWGTWRGYEGAESWVNPYSSSTYVSNGGLCGFDADYVSLSSWNSAWTKADVASGSWFFTRSGGGAFNGTFQRCDDLGQRTVNLDAKVGEGIGVFGKFGLCRDKGRSTVYVITSSNAIKRSIDGGETFTNVLYNGQGARFSNTVIATDPNNSDIIYLGQQGRVLRYYVEESRYEEVGSGLPNVACTQLMFHEGSGDLYFYHNASGFYILEYNKETGQYAPQWRFWTKGYNISKSKTAVINYTTQEMVLCDFGYGVWCADLEHPSDRFFDKGFKLKECSFKDGRHTIGIDTEWTIPLYYYFKWTVNGEEVTDNPYQYLRRRLNPGDKVQLELTLRESPDVKTLSEVFVVPATGENGNRTQSAQLADGLRRTGESGGVSYDNPVVKESGLAVQSNGAGRIDLGYFDYFFNDFTIEFWIKPVSDGSIIANTSRTGMPKGFDLYIQSGRINFAYYPRNTFSPPRYETGITQNATVGGGGIKYNLWSHVAITHEREGNITIYVDGKQISSAKRILPEATLNNSMVLSLFADAIERNAISASLDELKIWTKALSQEEVRREMFSTNCERESGLAAYWSFNGGSLKNEIEEFSRHPMKPRTRGEVKYHEMTVPTCASGVIYDQITSLDHCFGKDGTNVLGIRPAAGQAAAVNGAFGVYIYDSAQWNNEEDNLDSDFYIYEPAGYMIHAFDNVNLTKSVDLDFYPNGSTFNAGEDYRFFVTATNLDKQVWENVGKAKYDEEKGVVTVTDLPLLKDIVDKKLLLVKTLPSVEIQIDGMDENGVVSVYDETQTSFPVSARVLGNLAVPEDMYNITPNGILLGGNMQFVDGKATGKINLDLSKLGAFNTDIRTTLRSKDNQINDNNGVRNSLIPLTIDVRNRMSPTALGKGLYLNKASAQIGSYEDFRALMGATDFTIAGWVRIDDPAILQTANYNLMTFKDGGNRANGIVLDNGKIVLVWNGAKLTASSYAFTEEDLGNWVHLAVIKRTKPNDYANKVEYYKNGIYYGYARSSATITTGVGSFCLGKNSAPNATSNADNFTGAFDQIGVWTRGISQDEVYKYMYSAPPLNDPGLILFANMDYVDGNGVYRDCYSNAEIQLRPTANLQGSASFDEESLMPYEARLQTQWNDTEAVVSLEYPGASSSRFAVVSTFRGTPHNYYYDGIAEYIPLSKEYYTITFLQTHMSSMFGDEAVVIYRNPIIRQGDKLAIGLRRVGSTGHLSGFIHGEATEEGVIRFNVPGDYVKNSTEVMFFMYPSEGDPTSGRLSRAELSFAPSIAEKLQYTEGDDVPVLELEHGVNEIPIEVNYINIGRYTDDIKVNMESNGAEAQFATADGTLDLSQPTNYFTIKIDRSKTDRRGINDLEISIDNVFIDKPLKLKFYYRPFVQISLVNDEHSSVIRPEDTGGPSTEPKDPDDIEQAEPEDPEVPEDNPDNAPRRVAADTGNEDNQGHTFTARTPWPSFELKAELIEGYLPDGAEVGYDIRTDMPAALQIGNGSLLQNQTVTIDGLEFHESYAVTIGSSYFEGWNLIGNPYLTNINLTTSQNVNYEADQMTKYIYHCNPLTGNYEVHDMTSYDAEQTIAPFQSYFVQTMGTNSYLGITPTAKKDKLSKRELVSTYSVEEKKELTLALVVDGKEYDRVTIAYDPTGSNAFLANEDAAKLWNLSASSPELFATTSDNKSVAVTTVNADKSEDISLGIKAPDTDKSMKLVRVSMTGFSADDHPTILDTKTNEEWDVYNTPEYSFTPVSNAPGGDNDDDTGENAKSLYDPSYFRVFNYPSYVLTGITDIKTTGYKIIVEGNMCTVTGLQGDAYVAIHNINGIRAAHTQTSEDSYTVNLADGIYVVSIRENGKEYTSKITIQ